MDLPQLTPDRYILNRTVVINLLLKLIEERKNIARVWFSSVILYSSIKLKYDEEIKRKKKLARKLLQLSSDESEECRHILYTFIYRID